MATLDRDGVTLWYEDEGTGGPPLLLSHGWMGNSRFMAPVADHFKATRRVVNLDRRGHGRSDKPEQDYTMAGFADDFAWLAGQIGLEPAVVVQHSTDQIALDLAMRYPDLVAGIVLIDSAGFAPAPLADNFRQLLDGVRSPAYREVLTRLSGQIVFSPYDDPACTAEILAEMLATPQHVIVSTWAEALAYDFAPAASACRVPVLRIGAVFPWDAERFRSHIPQLLTAEVVGAGHFPQLEVPGQVNAMIERFVDVVVAPRATAAVG